jgi:6-phosphogluconolactonase
VSVNVYEDTWDLADAATHVFADRARSAIEDTGRFTVALAGGSTPKMTYEMLAREYPQGNPEDLDWSRVHVFFGDERAVPPEDEDSNYRMAREALLDHVPVGSVHRMQGELPPDEAAAAYEEELRGFFGPGELPGFDLILLGIGGDGHTASLFPETSALEVHDRLVVANPVLKLDTTRITLTVPVINAARSVLFLVAGEGKAEALAEILEGDPDPRAYPASLIQPQDGPVWMLDRPAASRLP